MIKNPLRHLKIFHKVLLIVLLPCLINAGLLFTLEQSLDRSFKLMQLSKKQNSIVYALSADLLAVTGILGVGNNAVMNGAAVGLRHIISPHFDRLGSDIDRIAADMPAEQGFDKIRSEIIDLIARQKAFLKEVEDPRLADDSVIIKLTRARPWLKLCGRQSFLLENSLRNAQETFQRALVMQKQQQQTTSWLVLATIVFNACFATLLAFLFKHDLSRRIASVVKNAHDVANQKAPTAAVGGKDEIYELNRYLQVASLDLSNNENFRRSVMQMMAHDIRSPLMAATISLEVIDRSFADAVLADSAEILLAVNQRLRYCLALINDLLMLESLETGHVETREEVEQLQVIIRDILNRPDVLALSERITVAPIPVSASVRTSSEQLADGLARLLAAASERAVSNSPVSVEVFCKEKTVEVVVRYRAKESTEAEAEIFDKHHHIFAGNNLRANALSLPVAKLLIEAAGGRILYKLAEPDVLFIVTLSKGAVASDV